MSTVKWIIEFIWGKFELFIRRTVLPSSIFLTLMLLVDETNNHLFLNKANLDFWNNQSITILIITSVIFLLAISYILKFLAQLMFDNLIKANFDSSLFFCKKENEGFLFLRKKVLKKVKKEHKLDTSMIKENDQILYQILGRLLNIDTSRYATDTKEAGITVVSMMLALGWYGYLHNTWLVVLGIAVLYYIGFIYIKTKYRSRAYRLYVNYLTKPKNKKKDKENEENK